MIFELIFLPLLAEAFSSEQQKTLSNHSTTVSKQQTAAPPSPRLSEEEQARLAAACCLEFWSKPKDRLLAAEQQKAPKEIHEECLVTSVSGESSLATSIPGSTFSLPSTKNAASALNSAAAAETATTSRIISVVILPVGSRSAATVRVTSGSNEGFLSLLKSPKFGWICIHAAFSSATSDESPPAVLPWDFQEISQLVWERYREANRCCDREVMEHAFHSSCRLTFVADGNVRIVPQPAFLDMVKNRYAQGIHMRYAALQNHPDVERHDTLQSIDFASPNLCLVTLKVGHPPCVWTDFLVCCKMGEQWWIVHKSSCQEVFELNEELEKTLAEQN